MALFHKTYLVYQSELLHRILMRLFISNIVARLRMASDKLICELVLLTGFT